MPYLQRPYGLHQSQSPDPLRSRKRNQKTMCSSSNNLARKRKRTGEDTMDGLATQSDEVAIPDEEAERLHEKAERKKARKETKRATKLAAAQLSKRRCKWNSRA